MMRRYRISSMAALPAIAAMAWFILAPEFPQQQSGVVKIAANGPAPVEPATPATPEPARQIPIVATQRQVDLADDQSYRIAREKRDAAWARRSETALRGLMHGISYVGGARRLDITCAATLCEVVGLVDLDPATNSYQPMWERLERDSAAVQLAALGLERTAAIFDTGRNPDEFKIQYRRVP